MAEYRVVGLEDYEPFRRLICSTLSKRPDLQIVSEVSDGLEAVLKVRELRPDLILMDVGLPSLSGIEAARQISELSPTSRIIFVSQESSAEVVQEAFRAGALGYVFKTPAGVDLLAAVDAVCKGFRFVSEGLARLVPSELAGKQPTTRFHQDAVSAPARDVGD